MKNPVYKTQSLENIRFECLCLANRPGLSPHEVIAIAKEYLAWVEVPNRASQQVDLGGSGDSPKVDIDFRGSLKAPVTARK